MKQSLRNTLNKIVFFKLLLLIIKESKGVDFFSLKYNEFKKGKKSSVYFLNNLIYRQNHHHAVAVYLTVGSFFYYSAGEKRWLGILCLLMV